MSDTILKTRLVQKHDIEANWIKAGNATNPFIPLKGEIIIYDNLDKNGNKVADSVRYKIGDGISNINELPFNAENAESHINNKSNPHEVTAEQIGALPLSGDTMTGNLTFATTKGIKYIAADNDTQLWQVHDSSGAYGYALQYNGSGSGNNNDLVLISDNQNGTKINAVTMKQDGTTTFAKKITASGGIAGNLSGTATKATQDASGNTITSTYETKTDASTKLAEAKSYADTTATNAATKVKNDLLNGAGGAYDTLKELGDLINDNQDAIDALETVAAGKADKSHSHAIADVSGLQSALDGKVPTSRTINGKALSSNITLNKSDIGLDNVDNTADANKTVNKANYLVTHDMSNKDLNTIKTAGWYYGYTGMTNAPVQAISVMEVIVYSPDWILQRVTVLGGSSSRPTYERTFTSATTWSNWRTVITTENIGSQSVASATKATQDGNGNVITSTYATKSAYDAHKHSVSHTPAGTVSKPTFTGSAVTSGKPDTTNATTIYSITDVGSVPSLTAAVSNRCLTFTWSAGSVPTRSSAISMPNANHTHSVTAAGSVSQPTFTGTEATLTTGTPK